MSDRTTYIGVNVGNMKAVFDIVAPMMDCLGVTLVYPGTDEVVTLTTEGDPIRVHRDAFLAGLSSQREPVSFLWWFSDSETVYCRIRRGADRYIAEFGMEGLDEHQEARFKACAQEEVDRYIRCGVQVEFAFAVDSSSPVPGWQ